MIEFNLKEYFAFNNLLLCVHYKLLKIIFLCKYKTIQKYLLFKILPYFLCKACHKKYTINNMSRWDNNDCQYDMKYMFSLY